MPLSIPESEFGHPRPAFDRLKQEFDTLVTKWRDETEDSSILALRFIHPAYMRIIGMGPVAIPWVLSELKAHPDWWFDALTAMTGEEPANGTDSFDSAIEAWLAWGRAHNYNV